MAYLDCLKDYIGLLENGADSGLALINLPGITPDNFSGINSASLSQDDATLWTNIKARSLKKLLTAALAELNRCYKVNDPVVVDCLLCEKKELFATPLWYLLGAETMIERKFSDRVNRWTSIDKPEAEELLAYYTTQFEDELSAAVRGLSPDDSDCSDGCIECGGNLRMVEGTI
jgi:hypothetical protein